MYKIRVTKKMGRGIYATRDIDTNTLVHEAEIIKVLEKEVDNCPTLARYAFIYSRKYSMFILGDGSLFNHSDDPNIELWIKPKENREVIHFITRRAIRKGEQLFISYGDESYAFYDQVRNQ